MFYHPSRRQLLKHTQPTDVGYIMRGSPSPWDTSHYSDPTNYEEIILNQAAFHSF